MKLNYRRTFFIGLAFMSISAFWQIYDSIIPLILKHTFEIGDTLAGGIMAIDNVLALFMLPLFGAFSDQIKTGIGKRMPFILGGTALAVVAMVLIPVADNVISLPLFVVVLFLALVAMSTYRSPAVALMPDVTPKPLRSQANGIINLMGALGAVFSLALISFLVPDVGKPDYLLLFAIVAVFMVVAVAILFFTIKENKIAKEMAAYDEPEKDEVAAEGSQKMDPAVKRSFWLILASIFFWFFSYNAVTTAFSKYLQSHLGVAGGGFASSLMIATVAAVIAFIPAGMIAARLGRKRTILTGIVVLAVSFALASLFTTFSPLLNILLVFVGFGWAAINVNSYPMVVEMAKGPEIGKYTGYYYTASMSAQILTPVLSGFFLEHVGYGTLFPYATVFMILAFLTMSQVKHGDSKLILPQKSKLEFLDVED
ncbi:MAG: SLC45 family MFS transporter [Firmicutes bacterium]|nr:SLC45 family MFS transporter [Bacillota bacterium]